MLLKDSLDSPWPQAKTVDPDEIARFSTLAEEWWNPDGKFRAMHKFNPIRRDYIIATLTAHFDRAPGADDALKGLRILDVGCGAGLLCEPLAACGAEVVGIDATARNVEVARWHAALSGLTIDYRHCLAEHLVADGDGFDVVLNMEVIEHVADPAGLMADCCRLVRPAGLLTVATLNRTLRSYLLAIVAAEHLLGWLPKGTHEWRRFLRPSEIRAMTEPHGLEIAELTGVSFNPLTDRWRLSGDTGVNFMMLAKRPA